MAGSCLFFASGRAALLAGLAALGIAPDDEVLLPAYLCESVVTPVETVGARPVFFPVARTLGVGLAGLEAAIGSRARAVVLIHYFGFPGPVEEVRAICERRGLALIEDCAHALYSQHRRPAARLIRRPGDLQPVEVAAATRWRPAGSQPAPTSSQECRVRRPGGANGCTAGLSSARRSRTGRGLVAEADACCRGRVYDAGSTSRSAPGRSRCWPARRSSWRLLRGARRAHVVGRRRRHFARLLDACQIADWARPLYTELPNGVCPLGLPLVVEDHDR